MVAGASIETSNVTDMCFMFCGCRAFNKSLRWNVSNVTNMNHMFFDSANFKRNLCWDMSKVTNADLMFSSGTGHG